MIVRPVSPGCETLGWSKLSRMAETRYLKQTETTWRTPSLRLFQFRQPNDALAGKNDSI
jgi:hypothetical protein